MTKIAEIMPPNMPRWMWDAIAEGLLARRCMERVEGLEAQIEWLDNNTTFFDVNHDAIDGYTPVNVPVLASVSKRIWYHATDDVEAYPFSAVVKKALEQGRA